MTFTEWLESILPHGSGIDLDWSIRAGKNGAIYASNSYHVMSEFGMYIRWIDFTLKLVFSESGKLTLETINFHGQLDKRIGYLWMLDDYLYQVVDHALESA